VELNKEELIGSVRKNQCHFELYRKDVLRAQKQVLTRLPLFDQL